MKRWIKFCLLSFISLAIASCGVPNGERTGAVEPTIVSPPAPTDELLIQRIGEEWHDLAILNTSSGTVSSGIPLGVPNADWSVVYTLARGELKGHTTLRAVSTRNGQVLRETNIKGEYQLPVVGLNDMPSGLSPNGRWLVLVDYPRPGAGQEQGKFAVLETSFKTEPTIVELEGAFSFDAINNDATSLYLTEHLAKDLSKYQVRRYDMQSKQLDPHVIVDKTNQSVMRGVRHVSLPSRTGEWLFTLYLNDAQGPFIHALNLNNAVAMCVPLLPDAKNDHTGQLHWSLVLSPGKTRLYAINSTLGLVSTLDTSTPNNVSHTRLNNGSTAQDTLGSAGHTHSSQEQTVINPNSHVPLGYAAISRDGETLYSAGMAGITVIDTTTMKPRVTLLDDTLFDSLVLSSDNSRLYAVSSTTNKLVEIDTVSNSVVRTLDHLPTLDKVLHITPR